MNLVSIFGFLMNIKYLHELPNQKEGVGHLMKNIFTILFLFVAFQSVGQSTLYVSPTGNDNLTVAQNSINTPWRTLQKACNSAPVGSTVYFRGGVYPSNSVVMNVSGLAGNYIKFKNYAQEVPVIDGGDASQTLLQITNRAYLIIDGLHFKNVTMSGSRGVMIEGNSHHIEIRNCKISEINVSDSPTYMPASCSDNVSPLKVCGENNAQAINNIIIANNEVFSCKTGCSEGIAVSGNVDGFLIEKNTVHDISNIGIVAAGFYSSCGSGQARNGTIRGNVIYNCQFPNPAINTTASGIYLDGAKNMIVEQNRVYSCQVGIHVGCETTGQIADNNTVRNNIVYNNEKWGIGMGGYVGKGFVENCRIINNTTFYNNYFYNGSYGNFGEILLQQVRNSSINNNICYIRYQATHAVFMKWEYPALVSNITINHNTYFTPDACSSALLMVREGSTNLDFSAYQALGYDVSGNTLNPQFINPSLPHPYLHLQLSSPLINTADNALASTAGSVDFDGNARQVTNLDRGAYEFQPCPPFYNLFGISPVGSAQYKASQAITSVGEVPITANTTYQAAQSIELKPNFKVEKGAIFAAQIAGCGNNWVEMFNEDFNPCSSLSDKWERANREDYNSTICNYLSSIPQIASFDNKSCLQITAQKIGNTSKYQSGHCKSYFSFKPATNEEYHVSASIKLIAIENGAYRGFAQTYGAWPAFWTVNEASWPTKGEIDIMEAYSFGSPNNVNYASDIHYGVAVNTNQVNAKVSYNAIGEGWHTYEQLWRNQNGTISVTIKIDGITKAVYTNATIPNLQLQNFDAHNIILNLNVGSTTAPIFNNANINLFSQTMMYVDYVKVRKRAL